jgi:hypothetical protein
MTVAMLRDRINEIPVHLHFLWYQENSYVRWVGIHTILSVISPGLLVFLPSSICEAVLIEFNFRF